MSKNIYTALAAAQEEMSDLTLNDRFPLYAFSADGFVVSFTRRAPFRMTPIRMGEYMGLQLLDRNNTRVKEYIHRLIAETFHGPCPVGMMCCHADGDKTNNTANNLRWDTPSANNLDKIPHGTAPICERNPMAKLTTDKVRQMRRHRAATGDSYAQIAALFDVSTMTAYRAIIRQSWSQI